jgi:hypothetical protein
MAAWSGDQGDPGRDSVAHDPTLGRKTMGRPLSRCRPDHESPVSGRGTTRCLNCNDASNRSPGPRLRRRPTGAEAAGSRASAGSSRGPGR